MPKTIKHQDWLEEGKNLFGDDFKVWAFVCPSCKTVQTANDFLELKIKPTDIERTIAFSCIGRFTKEKGCDWTLGGLLQIHELEVVMADGKLRRTFVFAEPQKKESDLWKFSFI